MAKPKDLESWGRATARKRYAAGGGTEPDADVNIEEQGSDRGDEVDQFISQVMRDQVKKMRDE